MSSKSTILLSNDNEHWYHDCIDDTFCIEFDLKHLDKISKDDTTGMLVVEKGTALYEAICKDIFNRDKIVKRFIERVKDGLI